MIPSASTKANRKRGAKADRTTKAAGVSVFYLPAFSPDLNPIEQVFAKLKTLLRAIAARTKEALWSTIGQLLDGFSPTE